MIRQDYLLRLIEQFGQLWAQLVGQLRARAFPTAHSTLDLAYTQVLGISAEAAARLTSSELLARMQFGVPADAGRERCFMLSALLHAEAELAGSHDADLAAQFHQKALDIVLTMQLQLPEPAPPTYAPSAAQLVAALADYQVPEHTVRLLIRYYEQLGAFALAEDRLFELRTQAPADSGVQAFGEAFYRRLRACTDAQLHAGNFSRAEVEAGLRAWRKF